MKTVLEVVQQVVYGDKPLPKHWIVLDEKQVTDIAKEYARQAIEEQLKIVEYQSNYMAVQECTRVELP